MLEPFLQALDPAKLAIDLRKSSAAPACVCIEAVATVLCATSLFELPLFRADMLTAAWRSHVDSITIRHGAHPETLDDVEVDVVLGRHGPAQIFWNYIPARAADGGYWLFPPLNQSSRCLRLDAAGITPIARPPYVDPDERAECIGRAARDTVLALRRRRRS